MLVSQMKNRKCLTSLLLSSGAIVFSTISQPVLAEEKVNPFYFKAGVGLAWTSDIEGDGRFDTGTTSEGIWDMDTKYAVDESSFNLGAGIGKEFGDWRLELAYNQNTANSDSFSTTVNGIKTKVGLSSDYEVKVKNYHFNVIKDFNKGNNFSPYIGIGAGATKIESPSQSLTIGSKTIVNKSETIDVFSWTLIGGISYNVNESTSLFSEATYSKTSEFKLDNPTIPNEKFNYDSISQTNLLAGVRFRF